MVADDARDCSDEVFYLTRRESMFPAVKVKFRKRMVVGAIVGLRRSRSGGDGLRHICRQVATNYFPEG